MDDIIRALEKMKREMRFLHQEIRELQVEEKGCFA